MELKIQANKSEKEWGGLSRGPASFQLISLLGSEQPTRAAILCNSEEEAEKWFQDLEYFSKFLPQSWKDLPLLFLPGWEQSPYRLLQPSSSSRLERLRVLNHLSKKDSPWIVVGSFAAFQKCAPEKSLFEGALSLKVGLKIQPDSLIHTLTALGYGKADSVEDPGNFSERGGIIDIFTPALDNPIRVEFFDENIESIRVFNPESQRSIRTFSGTESVAIIPVRDFFCDLASLQKARERLKNWCDHNDFPKASRERYSTLLSQGIAIPEMDYLLPFLQEKITWLPELLGHSATLILPEPETTISESEIFLHREQNLFEQSKEKMQPIPEPEQLYQRLETFVNHAAWDSIKYVRQLALKESAPQGERIYLKSKKGSPDIEGLSQKCRAWNDQGISVVLVANSQSQIDRISFLLSHQKIRTIPVHTHNDIPQNNGIVASTLGTLSESFYLPSKKIVFISEDEIFGQKSHLRTSKKAKTPPLLVDDLSVGDLVVHADHGIGRYQGLQKITALQSEGDFAILEYADGDKLYVPVYRLETLNRYVGTPGAQGALDKLGSGSFTKTKDRVKSAVKEIAQALLRVNAERATKEGFQFSPPNDDYRTFEGEFPFDETPDQEKAILDTLDDMCNGRPMDRLICGDVGFGKTEVAIRAAFKAAQDGKQVAVLVPTTILAEQHYQTFSTRMANHPVKLASISRFRSKKEQDQIIEELKNGKLDIVIGTHRLLSKDVQFKDLGLLIIDEEQRFGVEHKEKLKMLKATTDVLTLTATPIPRTLQMSLMGLKDVSIIRTPPGDRLSIKTYLSAFDEEIIQTAIRNELSRGGQVFFIHNRVQTIHNIEEIIRRVVPEAKCVVAHGQMPETALEKAMVGFYQKQFDVLIATAIIENGLDVPNANTLIVNRADTFGLSQLYQIRGRVGRSQTRAFAYFLVPETGLITEEARERLSVLQRFVELGSGYNIATYDLEIRGGGDVLGQAQSGHIASVGYDMYLELLQDEILRLKGEKSQKKHLEEVEINVPFSALLPAEYVPDMKSRIALYRRLSSIDTEEAVEDSRKELEDRYGPVPREAEELLWILRLKVLMRRMGFKAITLGPKGLSISPGENPILEPGMIMALVQARPKEYSILPDGKFILRGEFKSVSQAHNVVRQLLQNATQ